MQEIITVTKIGRGSPYYEVASTVRQNGTHGSIGAFTQELEALQFARRHHQQHQGSPYNAVLQLTEDQCQVLAQAKSPSGQTIAANTIATNTVAANTVVADDNSN